MVTHSIYPAVVLGIMGGIAGTMLIFFRLRCRTKYSEVGGEIHVGNKVLTD